MMGYRKVFITTLIILMSLLSVRAVDQPAEVTLCYYSDNGGGQMVSWKGTIRNEVVCKFRYVTRPETVCNLTRFTDDYLVFVDARWKSDHKVVCRYQRR